MTIANSADRTVNDDEESDGDGLYSDAIESVAFLARSEHRIRVLSLLDAGTRDRDEISEEVGVTRVTLSRILGDLEERELIARHPATNTYELTRYGELVYEDFERLLGTVSVGRAFPDVVERLPTEWFDFDLRCLADGELVTGESSDPLAAARVVGKAVQNASSRNALLGIFLSLPLHTFEEALRVDDEPDGAVVFDAEVAETMLEDPDLCDRWQKIESIADSPVYYRVDERVPCAIALIDGTVFLTVDGDDGKNFDVIRCGHPDVVAWADDVIGEYRARAEPLQQYVDDA